MKFKGIGHVALRAKDFKAMGEFYQNVLEFPKAFDLLDENGDVWISYFKIPSGQFIEMFPGEGTPGHQDSDNGYVGDNRQCNRSHYHACFEVDARHEAYRDMAKKGVEITHTADDTVGMCGSWCSFIEDPEGNQWEFMEFSPVSKQIEDTPSDMRFKG